jgi:hypothetical protein
MVDYNSLEFLVYVAEIDFEKGSAELWLVHTQNNDGMAQVNEGVFISKNEVIFNVNAIVWGDAQPIYSGTSYTMNKNALLGYGNT